MRLPPSLHEALSRPAVKRWLDYGRQSGERVWRRAAPLLRRVRVWHVAMAASVLLALLLVVIADVVIGSPSTREIRAMGDLPVATVVHDQDDAYAFTIFEERRHEMPLDRVSPHLIQAVLAIEDQRFFRHHGLDIRRIAGSVWANIWSASLEQGASTITQQLAKLSFLTPEKTWRRKLKEAYLALRVEQIYSKEEILEIYLNKIYFGDGLHGVDAAARGYFGRSAADLELPEATMLAGLIQRPSAYTPTRHPDRARARQAVVINQMVAAGMIDRETAETLAQTPVKLADGGHEQTGAYFKQAVTRELVDRFGWDLVSRGGLRVFTSYDPVAQAAAEDALARGLAAIEARRTFRHPTRSDLATEARQGDESPDYLQGAIVALVPSTGAIRVLVGGRDYRDSQFDRVTQARRQSGSAFKPFVYAAALEQGHSPATLITGLNTPIATPEGPWLPDDGHGTGATAMTFRTALRTSNNRAAAQVLQTVGVDPAVSYVKRLGLDAPAVPSMVLGTGDVTLLSLTAAYAVFANGGLLREPFLIRRVEDAAGNVLFTHESASTRVVSEATAFQITGMLADVIDRGTGWQARQAGFRHPAAGKTGTTDEYRDAWFVGYTPDLVAGAWVGFDRPRTIVPGGYASDLAVPLWGTFMRDATANARGRSFSRPNDVSAIEVCEQSGLLPGAACRRASRVSAEGEPRAGSPVVVEYFRRGTEPTEECPIHATTWYGRVVTAALAPSAFPAASTVGTLGDPPAPTAADDTAAEPVLAVGTEQAEPAAPERKRGFWGRVFGVFKGSDEARNRGEDPDGTTGDEKSGPAARPVSPRR
jgi:1A family penicillin-binding protein